MMLENTKVEEEDRSGHIDSEKDNRTGYQESEENRTGYKESEEEDRVGYKESEEDRTGYKSSEEGKERTGHRGPEDIIRPEDYVEPSCLLCDPPYGQVPEVKPIPQQRVIQKMDEYMSHRDYEGAGRHLLYWLEEARLGRDLKGQLLLCNELVGHYRKIGDHEKAMRYGEEAVSLLGLLEMEDSISAGTTYVNVGTACNAFGENEQAISYFEKARAIYESTSVTRHDLLGGLYNNMALACAALGRYDEAFILYGLALEQMGEVGGGALEQAITYLNMADVVEKQSGLEEGEERICDYLDKASELLDNRSVKRDGYYAFVCEKCAPVFEYYGYFLAARDLTARAEEIYGREI